MNTIKITGFAQGSTDPLLNAALHAAVICVTDRSEVHKHRNFSAFNKSVVALAENRGWDVLDTADACIGYAINEWSDVKDYS